MPQVYNIKDGFPSGAVLVDRTTPFGNPFIIGKDGTRKEVIAKFIRYLDQNPELTKLIKETLYNKDLVCHCKPKPCHGDHILFVANSNALF